MDSNVQTLVDSVKAKSTKAKWPLYELPKAAQAVPAKKTR